MNFIDCYEELTKLNEVKLTNIKDDPDDIYYHFFEDLDDLLSSLNAGIIYSNKNQKVSQYDIYADKNRSSYVCMTNTQNGIKWLTTRYSRPIGIGFNKDVLINICKTKNYEWNPNEYYNQFSEKAKARISNSSKNNEIPQITTRLTDKLKDFHDFKITAIGKLKNSPNQPYFIAGGQGRSSRSLWPAVRFADNKLYQSLVNWFKANMEGENTRKQIYYWFKDNDFGTPTKTFKDKPINTNKNLNIAYKPWEDTEKTANNITHNGALVFDNDKIKPGGEFEEIIGWGPLKVYDEEDLTKLVLEIPNVNLYTKGGWTGPNFYGPIAIKDPEDDTKEKEVFNTSGNNLNMGATGKGGTKQINYWSDEETFKAISSLYNESETRIYMPKGKNFYYTLADIHNIILPNKIEFANKLVLDVSALELLFDKDDGTPENYKDKINNLEILEQLVNDQFKTGLTIIDYTNMSNNLTKTELLNIIKGSLDIKNSILELIKLFNKLPINFPITYIEKVSNKKAKVYSAQKFDTIEDKVAALEKESNLPPHQRYFFENNQVVIPENNNSMFKPDLKTKYIIQKGETNTIAEILVNNKKLENVRLGVEALIVGADEAKNAYILLVDCAYRGASFFELPGGGYDLRYDSPSRVLNQRLNLKCGIKNTAKDITWKGRHGLNQYGWLLFNDSKELDTRKNTGWYWACYQLYVGSFNHIITDKEHWHNNSNDMQMFNMDRNVDRPQEDKLTSKGYDAFSIWVPLHNIIYGNNNIVRSRYLYIIDIAKEIAKKQGWEFNKINTIEETQN